MKGDRAPGFPPERTRETGDRSAQSSRLRESCTRNAAQSGLSAATSSSRTQWRGGGTSSLRRPTSLAQELLVPTIHTRFVMITA